MAKPYLSGKGRISLCGAKLPFLLSLLSYLFSGNDNLREERRTKRVKRKEQKETTIFCRKLSFLFGAGSGGRTRTVSLPLDFESSTSANSITPASLLIISHYKNKINRKIKLCLPLPWLLFCAKGTKSEGVLMQKS